MKSRSTSPDTRNKKRKSTKQSTATSSSTSSIASIASSIATPNNTATTDYPIKNHDLCDACGGVGQFLCCDACPNAFHFTCVEPPMDSTDVDNIKGQWFCRECEHKRKVDTGKTTRTAARGLFQKLIEDVSIRNPKSYKVPDDIIYFFEGVSCDKLGNYVDTTTVKHVKYKNGQPELPDYHPMKDRNGKFITCYKCRKTAVTKPMIACDYCCLYWHLDCLNPPMASPPNPAKKWMCPNHIENIVKPPRKRRYPQSTTNDNEEQHLVFDDNVSLLSDEIESTVSLNNKDHTLQLQTENIITSKKGVVYRLPENPVQFTSSKYEKLYNKDTGHNNTKFRQGSIPTLASSSASDISTSSLLTSPTTSHHALSQKANDKEIDAWLHNMAWFQSGGKILEDTKVNEDAAELLLLIKAAATQHPKKNKHGESIEKNIHASFAI